MEKEPIILACFVMHAEIIGLSDRLLLHVTLDSKCSYGHNQTALYSCLMILLALSQPRVPQRAKRCPPRLDTSTYTLSFFFII